MRAQRTARPVGYARAMHALLLAAVVAAPASARVLVLELEPVSVDKQVARSIDPIVLNGAGVDGAEIIAQSEIKAIAAVEAQKADVGCDTSSCLAELAGAMGAQYVLFGSVSKLGSTTTVALSLYDSATGAIARDSLAVADVGLLPKDLPPRVHALVARVLDVKPAAPPPPAPPPDADPPGALYYLGLAGVVLGGASVVMGGVLAAANEIAIDDPTALAGTKRNAQATGAVGLVLAGAGALVAAGGIAAWVLE